MPARAASPLTIALLAAFVLLLIATISAPLVKSIPLGSFNGVNYGVFGFCEGGTCTHAKVGYPSVDTSTTFSLSASTRKTLSSILVVHPVAAALALICTVLAFAAHFHSPAHSSGFHLGLIILMLPTFILTLLAFVIDILVFVPHISYGSWLVLASLILIAIAGILTCTMRRTLMSRKERQKRIAENDEMNGTNFYSRENALQKNPVPSTTALDTRDTTSNFSGPTIPNPNSSSGNGNGFAVFDANKTEDARSGTMSSNRPLLAGQNRSGSDERSPSTTRYDQYGRQDRSQSVPRNGGMRRDQYGNLVPVQPNDQFGNRRPSQDQYRNDSYGRGGPNFRGRGGYPPQRGRGGPNGMMYGGPGGRGGYGPPPGRGGPYGNRGGPMYRGRGGYGPPPIPNQMYGQNQQFGQQPPMDGNGYGQGQGQHLAPAIIGGLGAGYIANEYTDSRHNSRVPSMEPYGRTDDVNPMRGAESQQPQDYGYGMARTTTEPVDHQMYNAPSRSATDPVHGVSNTHMDNFSGLPRSASPVGINGDGEQFADAHEMQTISPVEPGSGYRQDTAVSALDAPEHEHAIGQAVEMDERTGKMSPTMASAMTFQPVAAATNIDSNAYVPPRSQWTDTTVSSTPQSEFPLRSQPLHSDYASTVRPHGRKESSGSGYIEDVDPRFASADEQGSFFARSGANNDAGSISSSHIRAHYRSPSGRSLPTFQTHAPSPGPGSTTLPPIPQDDMAITMPYDTHMQQTHQPQGQGQGQGYLDPQNSNAGYAQNARETPSNTPSFTSENTHLSGGSVGIADSISQRGINPNWEAQQQQQGQGQAYYNGPNSPPRFNGQGAPRYPPSSAPRRAPGPSSIAVSNAPRAGTRPTRDQILAMETGNFSAGGRGAMGGMGMYPPSAPGMRDDRRARSSSASQGQGRRRDDALYGPGGGIGSAY